MLTQREPTLTTGVRGCLALLALATACITLAAMLSTPANAEAKTHTFRAVKVKHGVATFKLKNKVSARDVRAARVLSTKGTRRVALARVRRAIRRGYLRVRISRRRGRGKRVASKRSRDVTRKQRRSRPAKPTPKPAPSPAPATPPPASTGPGEPLPKRPTLVLETPDPPVAPGGSSSPSVICTGALAGVEFGVGSWPPACWRPFAGTSPFNQPIPSGARLTSDSVGLVARLNEAASGPKPGRANIPEGDDFHKSLFWARSTDPEYTVRGGSTTAPYDVDGRTLRVPDGARASGGGDSHLGVVYNGEEWCLYRASIDPASRTITVSSGRRIALYGDGRNAGATAARFGCLAGRIRYQELAAGRINHAVFMTASTTGSGFVYPAQKSDGPNGAGYPPMGTRFQLDPSYATDAWLAQFPEWKQGILRALRDYGGYLGDTTSDGWTAMPIESEVGYYAFGLPRPFAEYARARDAADPDISVSGGTYYFDLARGVDWSRLRAIDPCVAERTC